METKIYAANIFTLKDGASMEELLALIKRGVETTSSKNKGFVSDQLFQSVDGKTAINFSEWHGDIELFMANHHGNEANPDYQRQMSEVEKLASYAPMAYFKVFEYRNEL